MTQQQQNQSKSYADKVDLNDLDWEDRERVLRLLFSKMNAGVPPSLGVAAMQNDGRQTQVGGILALEGMQQ